MAGNEEGGLENHFVELSNALASQVKLSVIAHPKYKSRFDSQIDFFPLDLTKSRKNPLILWKIYRLIHQISPHIIHTHANKATAMLSYITKWLPNSIKTIASLHSQKKNLKPFYSFNCVIGVSHSVVDVLNHPCKRVIYNGIDYPIPHKRDISKEFGLDDGFCVCSVGRLESVKNFKMLISACYKANVNLIIAGDGTLKESLQNQIDGLNASDTIKLVGFREDVIDLIYSCDLCAISSNKEGFSYVMAESLLVKTPIISTDVADMKQILPNKYIVDVGDMDAMSDMVQYIKNNYSQTLIEYQKSFDFAKNNFAFDTMVESIVGLYRKVYTK
jgi:glycosyltransferase involved in cell wall biosynthesis